MTVNICLEQQTNKNFFCENHGWSFDITHAEVLGQMKNEQNKNLLIIMSQKEWPGFMVGVEKKIKTHEMKTSQANCNSSYQVKKF